MIFDRLHNLSYVKIFFCRRFENMFFAKFYILLVEQIQNSGGAFAQLIKLKLRA